MRIRAAPLAAIALAFLPLPHPARGADPKREIPIWWSPQWPYRKKIRLEESRRGWAAVHLTTAGLANPDGSDIRIVADNTRALPFALIDAGREDRVLVAFPIPDADREYAVYFGNAKASAPSPVEPKAGLILEVRALGEGGCEDWQAFRKLLGANEEVLGADIRPSIALGINPFGRQRDYIASYTGFLRIASSGTYVFATNSFGPSFLLVDGKVVAEWPGWHDAGGGAQGTHAGKTFLTAGLHRLEYHAAAGPRGQGHTAGIQAPEEERLQVLSAKHFEPWVRARIEPIEALSSLVALDFDWAITTDGGYEGRDFAAVRFEDRSWIRRDRARAVSWDFGDGQSSAERSPHHAYLEFGVFTVKMAVDLAEAGRQEVVQRVWVRAVGQRGGFEQKLARIAQLSKDYDLRKLSLPALENLVRVLRAGDDEARLFGTAQALFDRKPPLRDPEIVADAYRLGDYLSDAQGRFRQAIALYEYLAEKAPSPADRLRASVLAADIRALHTGEADAAKRGLEAALRTGRDARSDARRLAAVRLAEIDLAGGRGEEAEKRIEAIASDPALRLGAGDLDLPQGNHAFSFQNRLRAKEWVLAARELRAWELEEPRVVLSGEVALRRAELDRAAGRIDACLARIERIRKATPGSKAAARGILLAVEIERGRGKADRARELLREVIAGWPGSPEAERAREELEGLR
ncbi:MAG: PKD domain-containing protein [Planctomycetes bacterium]|nr:PKD domain-containing protein [Planctomycetota bacterium]